jgi:hypothetical protein
VARIGLVLWLLAMLGWLWTSEVAVFVWTFDDAYYYFEIARNLAQGHGPSFDRLTTTNGYHPLWLAVCTIVYSLGFDAVPALRVLLTLQVAMYGAFALLGLTYLRRHLADQPLAVQQSTLVIAGLLAINPSIAKVFVNGVEAPLSLLLQATVLAWLLRSDQPLSKREGLWALSVVLALAFLARTDAGLLTLTILVWGLLRGGPGVHLLKVAALPATVLGVFLVVNQWMFGAPTQVSGDLKRVTPSVAQWVLIVAMLLAAGVLLRVRPKGKFPRTRQVLIRTWPFGAFSCAVIAYYLGFQTFPRVWYFVPVVLWLLVLFCAVAADLLCLAWAERREANPDVAPLRAIAPIAVLLMGALGLAAAVGHSLGAAGVHHSRMANAEAGRWVSSHLPADAVLGSWDAGVVAYFTTQRVVNLDGVVNSVAYKEALRAGTAGRLVDQWGVTWLINHSSDPQSLREAAELTMGPLHSFEIERTWPFVVRGGINTVGVSGHEMAVNLVRIQLAVPAK